MSQTEEHTVADERIRRLAALHRRSGLHWQIGRVHCVLTPGLAVLVLSIGCLVALIYGLTAELGVAATGPDWAGSTAIVTGALLLAVGCHEGAHAVVGRLYGLELIGASAGLTFSVLLAREPTRWARICISAAGPLAELAAGAAYLALSPALLHPLGLAGVLAALNGAGGFLVPMGRRSDAWKMWRGARQLTRPGPVHAVGPIQHTGPR